MVELTKEEPFLLMEEMQIIWGSVFYSMKATIRCINIYEDSKVLPLTGEWLRRAMGLCGAWCDVSRLFDPSVT
jgi:hypothetical protein